MSLDPFSLALLGAILLASSILQGTVGFSSGLFGIPLFLWIGIPLPQAVAISLVASAVQNITGAWQLRHELDLRRAWRPMLIRYATLPLGVWALSWVGRESTGAASQLVGAVILAVLVLQWSLRITPQPFVHSAWEWLSMSTAGFFLGLCGMGGPPMVLWIMAHDWPMARGRALLFFLFATGIPPQALLLWLFFGTPVLQAMLLALMAVPILLVGIHMGLAVGRRIPDRAARIIATLLLATIAISSIAVPWLGSIFRIDALD
jgi:uncharacterized membrane protein YfcA